MVSSQAIQAMKNMAADPKKRAILVKDTTCIGGLVLVLSNPDESVVKLALETIQCLTVTPEHRPILRNFIGMMDQLQCISDIHETEVGRLAKDVYKTLSTEDQITPLKDTFNTSSNTSRRRSSLQKSLHGGLRLSKTIVLQMKGLVNKCDRDVCMRLLLQVKGVISITFDMNRKRCIVRTKPDIRPESLVMAIAKTQSIHAQQVIKTESGEELFLSFGSHPQHCDKENNTSDLPDYLPEEDEEPVDDKALARNKSESTAGSWLSSAASFLTNSFYW